MTLSFGEFQIVVLIVFGLIAVSLAALFVFIARQASQEVEFEQVRDTGYRLRRSWLAFLAFFLASVVGISLFFTPYSGGGEEVTAKVSVSSGQFYWSMSPPKVQAGSRVEFDVTSVDVNHGFGIYDPDGKMLGSVQAMPSYFNKLYLTLDQPGTYHISCLEFCGVKHHAMQRDFEVAP
jgi:cytochrome c oxidase subunit 2